MHFGVRENPGRYDNLDYDNDNDNDALGNCRVWGSALPRHYKGQVH
ncbi:hypothetical protein [Candidatus Thiodictyon syntrophicum]|jgi:hypothetical protein|nr:hypothetical protein [Candidatus Thiodictyon syntrophicum]